MKGTKRKRAAAATAAVVPEAPAESAGASPAPAASAPTIVLASHCSVRDAAAFKASLSRVFNLADEVTLDIGAVERIDTAVMQLLCAFVRDRAARGNAVAWRGDSAAFADAVRLLGVGSMLSFTVATRAAA